MSAMAPTKNSTSLLPGLTTSMNGLQSVDLYPSGSCDRTGESLAEPFVGLRRGPHLCSSCGRRHRFHT